MSEARELLERFKTEAHEVQTYFSDVGKSDSAYIFGGIVEALRRALATQPEPGAVPELPDWVGALVLAARDALDRLEDSERDAGEEYEEAIALRAALAARERARRAGS